MSSPWQSKLKRQHILYNGDFNKIFVYKYISDTILSTYLDEEYEKTIDLIGGSSHQFLIVVGQIKM